MRSITATCNTERETFLGLAADMMRIQEATKHRTGAARPSRTLHAKLVVGVTNATLTFDATLPPDFRVGQYEPAASFAAILRLSNASGVPQSDSAPDMRGAALRIKFFQCRR